MDHHFNVFLAQEYGVNAAIILNHITYWVNYNRTNNKNFHDGNWWVYHAVKAFNNLFPYMSEQVIKRTLKKLEQLEIVRTGRYNKKGFDRTKWYALNLDLCVELDNNTIVLKQSIAKYQNDTMESIKMIQSTVSKQSNGFVQNDTMESIKTDQPIPNNKTDNKIPNNKKKDDSASKDALDIYNFYKLNIKSGERKKALDRLPKILSKHSKDELLQSISNYITSKQGETNMKYYKAAGNFFNAVEGFYYDFLPSEYAQVQQQTEKEKAMQKEIAELKMRSCNFEYGEWTDYGLLKLEQVKARYNSNIIEAEFKVVGGKNEFNF